MTDAFPTFRRFFTSLRTTRFWLRALRHTATALIAFILLGHTSNVASLPTCRRLARIDVLDTARLGEALGHFQWLPRTALAPVSIRAFRSGDSQPPSLLERLTPTPPLVLPSSPPPPPWGFAFARFWPLPFVVHIHYGFDGGPLWSEAGYIEYLVVFGHVITQRHVGQFFT